MNQMLFLYNTQQLEEIQKCIEENFGDHGEYVAHEIASEYVHTDTMMIDPKGENRTLVTFGMGARLMNAPTDFERTELVLTTSERLETLSVESFTFAGELARISKFPFQEDTWFGPGHTVNVSDRFRETTGYDYFAFLDTRISAKLTGIDEEIHFLHLVPLYEEEREWCVEHNTFAFLDKLYEKYGEEMFVADVKRELFLPEADEDELADYEMMSLLGIDRECLAALREFLQTAEENGEEVSYEMIGKWIEDHR